MAVRKHGKNGKIKVAGASLTGANVWELNIDLPTAESSAFGDSWTEQAAGIASWSGRVEVWHDQDSKTMFTHATSGASRLLAIYPDSGDTTTYFSGTAFFTSFGTGGNTTDYISQRCDFVGSGTLTGTGFS